MNRLMKHPYQRVKRTQDFARHKQIRKATEKKMIDIQKGTIGIPDGFKIVKTKRGWRIINK